MDTFGKKIKNLRKDSNLTQKALAEKLSVTVSTLSHWECDYQEPCFDDLYRICQFFNVEADYLVGLKNEFEVDFSSNTNSIELSPRGKELIEIFETLAPEHQLQILEYARFFGARHKQTKRSKKNELF